MAFNTMIGNAPRFWVKFYDESDQLKDPTIVTFLAGRYEQGPVTIYAWPADPEVVKVSTGYFQVTYTLSEPGNIIIRWEGSGAVVATKEDRVIVEDTMLP